MRFSKDLYPKIALLKAAYAFTDRAYVHLDADDAYYYIELKPKPDVPAINEDDVVNELLCQSVRHEVYQKTKTIRELLIARAMASSVVGSACIAQQTPAQGSPELQQGDRLDEQYVENDILVDWFEAHGQP